MKFILAWAFTFLTISGAMIQSESAVECVDIVAEAGFSGTSQYDADSVVQTDRSLSSKSQHSHSDFGHHDCHHNGSSCHSSHLGHSVFTLGLSLVVPNVETVRFRFVSQTTANFFNLQANLFRPPIA